MFQQPQKSTPARFVTGVHLDMHGKVKSHIRVKSYKCQICEKAFAKKVIAGSMKNCILV